MLIYNCYNINPIKVMRNIAIAVVAFCSITIHAQDFKINSSGYFQNYGANVMVFSDVYPEGHQGGLTLVLNGDRKASNGDVRFEISPGQWQALPKIRERVVDVENNEITVKLSYPDSTRHLSGFNPTIYPDFAFNYTIKVKGEKDYLVLTVDLDKPVPESFAGKLGSNIEHIGNFNSKGKADLNQLLLDKSIYNPMIADDIVSAPFAKGKKFVLNPDDELSKITIESEKGDLSLYDGRINHNNGWFILRSEFPVGAKDGAVKWIIRPSVDKKWYYSPVVQTSQVGYHPDEKKVSVIELDSRTSDFKDVALYKIDADGQKLVKEGRAKDWGAFLRYHYIQFDFSDVKEDGLYKVVYDGSESPVFRIAKDVWTKGR